MTEELNREVRRLIVEAAIAAPNYGLMRHAKTLLDAFGALQLPSEVRALSAAMVYFGLCRPRAALAALKNQISEKAQELRAAILESQKHNARKKEPRN